MSNWDVAPTAASWYAAVGASGATRRSVTQVWNLTASAPASAAASTRRFASSRSPLWLTPASAMTKQRRASYAGAHGSGASGARRGTSTIGASLETGYEGLGRAQPPEQRKLGPRRVPRPEHAQQEAAHPVAVALFLDEALDERAPRRPHDRERAGHLADRGLVLHGDGDVAPVLGDEVAVAGDPAMDDRVRAVERDRPRHVPLAQPHPGVDRRADGDAVARVEHPLLVVAAPDGAAQRTVREAVLGRHRHRPDVGVQGGEQRAELLRELRRHLL